MLYLSNYTYTILVHNQVIDYIFDARSLVTYPHFVRENNGRMDHNVSTKEIILKSSCVMSNLFEKLVFQYCSCLKFGIWTFFFDFPKRLPTTFKSANHVMHICILLYRIIHFHNISSKFVFENVVLPHLTDNNAFKYLLYFNIM